MSILKSHKREISAPALKHILGIDQLRYVFALWVFFMHGGAPPIFEGYADNKKIELIDHFYGWCINGQAAVIGFFIISGLCIHYPNIRRGKLDLKSFYTARFLRLSLPLIVCLTMAKLLNYNHPDGFLHVVPIWTLYCEGAYYLIYPLVLWVVKKRMLLHLIALTSIVSVLLIIIWTDQRAMYFHEIGGNSLLFWKVIVLAFPFWMLGVLIAERISDSTVVDNILAKNNSLWKWRVGALLLSAVTFPLYRFGLYYNLISRPLIGLIFTSQFTLLLFGLYAFFWIEREIICINFGTNKPISRLEKMGLASYSLYLIHIMVLWLFAKINPLHFSGAQWLYWVILVSALHLAVFIYYLIVEKPSHKLAKFCANALRK